MEKTYHAALAGGGGGSPRRQASKERSKLSSSPPPRLAAQPGRGWFRGGPRPPRPLARPGPCGFETPLRSPANRGRPGTGAPRPLPPHPESKLARRGDSRHGVWPRSGRGRGWETRPPPSAAGWRARSRVPGARGSRGRRPALPSRSRTSRAAAEGALPAPARSRASSIARRPPPLEESRRGDGERLGAASRGFKDNNKKMATTQLPLRTPSDSATAPGGGG